MLYSDRETGGPGVPAPLIEPLGDRGQRSVDIDRFWASRRCSGVRFSYRYSDRWTSVLTA